jgi:hypothetical protein
LDETRCWFLLFHAWIGKDGILIAIIAYTPKDSFFWDENDKKDEIRSRFL